MLHLLLAKSDLYTTIRRSLRNLDTATVIFHLTVIVGAGVVLWLGVQWVDRIRTRRLIGEQTPQGLFWELCLAHRLSRAERALAQSAAPADNPCRLFIDPGVLARFAATPEADEYARLAERLFGRVKG